MPVGNMLIVTNEINEDVLEQLLLKNIYGIEKDPEAIKVTAFSLYLTYLKLFRSQKRFCPK